MEAAGGAANVSEAAEAAEAAGKISGASSVPVLHELRLPPSCQGYIWGTRGELRPAWADLGLEPKNVRFDATCGQNIFLTCAAF